MADATITGLGDMVNGLLKVDAALRTSALQQAADAAAAVLVNSIRPNMPNQTGQLRQALQVSRIPMPAYHARAAVEVANSKPGQANHEAIFVEYGTANMPAKPFMRTGFGTGAAAAQEAAISSLKSYLP